ncbi:MULTISPECIES: hypothetical protein [unclassified Halomonas]|uniref:hypothetical protein n=1 Tax=unclassified Halomonas TaxID=2609666 RepID=UPI003B946F54
MSVAQFGIPALQDNGATAVVLNEEGRPAIFIEEVEVDASVFDPRGENWQARVTERELEEAVNALFL